jgi:hypothetical protein
MTSSAISSIGFCLQPTLSDPGVQRHDTTFRPLSMLFAVSLHG